MSRFNSASINGITSNTVNIGVTNAVITSLQVTPATISIANGLTQQLTAMATYSDSTTADVTGLSDGNESVSTD